MTLDELLDAYRGIAETYDLPPMRTEQVRIEREKVRANPLDPATAAAQLARIIVGFEPTQGWLCYQSAVIAFPPGGVPGPDAGHGLLLSGELANAAREGLNIRSDGCGGWLLTRFTPGDGVIYLLDYHSFIAHEANPGGKKQPRRLCYRRYWTSDDHHGIRQAAACFIGFDGGN